LVTKKYDEAKTLFRKEQPKAIKFLKSSNRKIAQKIYNIRSKKFLLPILSGNPMDGRNLFG